MIDANHYRQLVQELLEDYSKVDFNNPELETETIFDIQRDYYPVVHVGWSNKSRVYG